MSYILQRKVLLLTDLTGNIDKILISRQQINDRLVQLGAEIANDYADKNLVCISILKGAFVFLADLIRNIPLNVPIDFMVCSSYGAGTTSTGKLNIIMDIREDIRGKDVLIIEDILDTGVTLSNVTKMLKERGAASVKICTLLDKPARHKVDIKADYTGFTIEDEFVIGYGLDFAEDYRNLPYVAVLKRSAYEK